MDYFTPQLYWPIRRPHQSFPVLLGWWKEQNQNGRHLWPGMTIGQGRTKVGIREVISQIQVTRGKEPVFLWVLYLFHGDQWTSQILPADSCNITLPETGEPTAVVAVSAVDRTGNESPRSFAEH